MKPHLKYGLIAGVAAIIWNLIMYLTGLDRTEMNQALGWVAIILTLVFVVLAVKEQRDINKGYITFGGGFKTGFLVFLIAGLISCIYFYIHLTVVDTGMIDFLREKTMAEMAKKNMPEDQIEIAMKYTNMFLSPGVMACMGFVMNLIVGAIAALIVAAIMKKDPPVVSADQIQ
ncbi:MAG: DUF4199 domain-containing protein [Bacteroidia bacterium]